jgi:hypothetical protein
MRCGLLRKRFAVAVGRMEKFSPTQAATLAMMPLVMKAYSLASELTKAAREMWRVNTCVSYRQSSASLHYSLLCVGSLGVIRWSSSSSSPL